MLRLLRSERNMEKKLLTGEEVVTPQVPPLNQNNETCRRLGSANWQTDGRTDGWINV